MMKFYNPSSITYLGYLLTLVSILGGSGGPRAGIVSCLAAPQSENPTKFFDPKRKS